VWIVDNAVVVGAGIGGLTASLLLSRVAARVTLVERAERPSEVGAALALQPNGMAGLERLGLLPAVEAVGARIDRMDIRSVKPISVMPSVNSSDRTSTAAHLHWAPDDHRVVRLTP
jgi:2-polyprenyl-6-methoxyphenol hydroxylase-like FAD-dependent oxidoreductase